MAVLDAELNAVQGGQPHVVLVEGEAGVGKSSLALLFALRRMRVDRVLGLASARPGELSRVGAAWGSFFGGDRRATRLVLGGLRLKGCGVDIAREQGPTRWKLTPGEMAVARLVCAGPSSRQVASELYVSVKAVEFHLENVFDKVGIRTRKALAEAYSNVQQIEPKPRDLP